MRVVVRRRFYLRKKISQHVLIILMAIYINSGLKINNIFTKPKYKTYLNV